MNNERRTDSHTPAVQQPAIEFRNVSVSFDDKLALDNITFQLPRGEMICITGVSGSGKSVLVRLAAGLLLADDGEVLVQGREIGHLNEQELLVLRGATMGIVFQEQSLFTGMTVYENTAYRLDEHGWPEADEERAVEEILRFVGLEEDVDKLPEELSVGMGRRLEFARALVGWPEIMLFDEPTSGLDPINARIMLDLVIRARDVHRISSLYVTKELHEIPYLARHHARTLDTGAISVNPVDAGDAVTADDVAGRIRVLVLDEGRAVFFGSPAEFEASDLPAVARLTHPSSSAPATDTFLKDPWGKSKTPAQ
ncbi:MAG TPA: ATP-binding cassette domain-containing protein [Blastocatellia bacterium]|nr:ATP-binding cassette domain-containing protein [Blastocatellia bacterium]